MNILEEILEEIERLEDPYYKDYVDRKHVVEIIRSHMDAEDNDGWIPVEERLPEEHMDVLVDFGDDIPVIAWYSCDNNTDIWKNSSTDNVIHIEVIAWAALPEPYKPK